MSYFLIFLLIFAVACEEPVPQKRVPASSAVTSQKPPAAKPVSWEEVLREFMRDPFEKKEDGAILSLKLKNVIPFSPAAFDKFLIDFSSRLQQSNIPFAVVMIEALGESQTIFKARFYLADATAFGKGEISQPELLRRFQVEVVETIESLKAKAKLARAEGRLADAKQVLEKWVAMEPHSLIALSLLGNVLRDDKKYWDAIALYKKIAELDPKSLFAAHNLGYAYERVGAFDDSIAAYRKALELSPADPVLMQQLAQVYGKNGDYNGAMVWIGKARGLKDTADLWMVEGNVNRDAKKYPKAREAYAKAQTMSPNDYRILFNLLLIDLDTKSFEEAKKKYEDLKVKDPLLAEELGGVYVFKGE